MGDLTPDEHAAEAEKYLGKAENALGPKPAEFWAQLATAHYLAALLASRPTTPDNELVRRAVDAETAPLRAELADAKAETDRMAAEVDRLRAEAEDAWSRGMSGAERIARERARQIEAEGWTPEHDDQHEPGQLVDAAACYALQQATYQDRPWTPDPGYGWQAPRLWPWAPSWWKPSADPIRNLEKAGALIAAEIDRLLRLPVPDEGSKDRG